MERETVSESAGTGGTRVYAERRGSSSRRRRGIAAWVVLAVLTAGVVALSVPLALDMPVDGDVQLRSAFDLERGTANPGVKKSGRLSQNANGLTVKGRGSGRVIVPVRFPRRLGDQRALLAIAAYGNSAVSTRVWIRPRGAPRRFLGAARQWAPKQFQVTEAARRGPLRVEVEVKNRARGEALFLDQVAASTAPAQPTSSASRWLVAGWAGLLSAALLQLGGWLGRHWILPPVVALAAYLFWGPVLDESLNPLSGLAEPLWEAVGEAKWFSLDKGLVSGSFGDASPLTVQLFHLLTPLTGTGTAGARAASALVGLLAVVALYAAGNRVAGRIGALVAVSLALLTDAFRLAATSGDATTTMVLAGAAFLIAINLCLARTSWPEISILGAAGALAILAEPVWWPGVVAVIAILAAAYGATSERLKLIGVGLLTLAVLILPNRVAVSAQNDGNSTADVARRATIARNIEFVGEGHGAPATRAKLAEDPAGGSRVGLLDYVFLDHSPAVVVGGTATGLYDGLDAAAERDETMLAGLVAFVVSILGAIYLLIVPRLRLLVILPIVMSGTTLFLASREAMLPFTASAAVWSALCVGGGVLAYVALEAGGRRWQGSAVFNFGGRVRDASARIAARVLRPRRRGSKQKLR